MFVSKLAIVIGLVSAENLLSQKICCRAYVLVDCGAYVGHVGWLRSLGVG